MDNSAEALTAAKRAAGYEAAEMVKDGMVLGLGTGSTVFFALERLSLQDFRRTAGFRCSDILPDSTTGP